MDTVAERHDRVPSVGSRARIELDGEHEYSAVSTWEKPIPDCHSFGAMSLRAATDNVRGFGTLFTGGQPPQYPHLVLGRSAFEGAVVSEWLGEPSVEPLERIKRGLCEQLYSAKEVEDLNLRPGTPSRVDEWVAVARSFGWTPNLSLGPALSCRAHLTRDGTLRIHDEHQTRRRSTQARRAQSR